jgi:ADP-ribose pyrophosphatase YjhB (NUDIX family)
MRGTEFNKFDVILLGVIFNPKTKRILIGRRKKNEHVPKLTWTFIGGRPNYGEEIEDTLKKKIKLKTGLDVENLGSIFSRTHRENREFLLIYHLCEVIRGKEKPADDFIELKWVKPEELENYFTTSFHPHVKEYILNLK